MDNKTLSIVSYVTLIGWSIAFFVGKDEADDFLKYHLRQSLGLVIITFILNIALTILNQIIPASGILSLIVFLFLALLIIGIVNAANGIKKPLPFIGKMFEDKFSFVE